MINSDLIESFVLVSPHIFALHLLHKVVEDRLPRFHGDEGVEVPSLVLSATVEFHQFFVQGYLLLPGLVVPNQERPPVVLVRVLEEPYLFLLLRLQKVQVELLVRPRVKCFLLVRLVLFGGGGGGAEEAVDESGHEGAKNNGGETDHDEGGAFDD